MIILLVSVFFVVVVVELYLFQLFSLCFVSIIVTLPDHEVINLFSGHKVQLSAMQDLGDDPNK